MFDIVFYDFDKTLFDIDIKNFDEFRSNLAREIKERFNADTALKPILEETELLGQENLAIKTLIYDQLDQLELTHKTHMYSYTVQLLNKFSDIPAYIISNNGKRVIEETLNKYKCHQYFTDIIARDSSDYFKPHEEILKIAIEKEMERNKSLKLTNFLFFGDSWRDYDLIFKYAKNNNCSFQFVHAKDIETYINSF